MSFRSADWVMVANLSDAELADELMQIRALELRGEAADLDVGYVLAVLQQSAWRWLAEHDPHLTTVIKRREDT